MERGRSFLVALIALGVVLPGMVGLASGAPLSNSGPVSGPGPISAPNGPTITVTGSADVNLTDPFPDANTLRLWTSKGNLTASSSGDSAATINFDDFEGTWTNATGLDVSSNALTVNPGDKAAVTVSGDTDSLNFTGSMAPDDGQTDFVYAGSSGTTTLTVNGLPTNTQMAAVDVDTNEVLAVATSDGTGSATFSGMPNSEHTVQLMTGVAPSVDNSSASPQGGAGQSSRTVTLSIDVSDGDFPNDEVDVEFFVDGSSIGTESITSNGTVSKTTDVNIGGTHNWSVTATDEYGKIDSSQTFEFQIPSTIFIRNETGDHSLINGSNVTVEGRFYSGELIFERSTSNGTINLTGLPVDRTYVLQLTAEDYRPRTVVVDSLFDQQDVYLLHENETAVFNTFVLDDNTGDFSPSGETELFIQKGINTTGTIEWQTIAGDTFGADGTFQTYLEKDQRYNLSIRNEEGRRLNLGAYRARSNGTVGVEVTENEPVQINPVNATVTFEPDVGRISAENGTWVNTTIDANDDNLTSYTVTATVVNGSTTTTLFTTTGSNPSFETIARQVNLSGRAGSTLHINATYTLANGASETQTHEYLIQEAFNNQYSVWSVLSTIPANVPDATESTFLALLSVVMLVVTIAFANFAVPLSTETNGLLAIAGVGVFAVLGWLPWYLFFAGGATFVIIAGLRGGV